MRAWPLSIWVAALLAPAPLLAQAAPPVVVSAKIDDAAVTVYRAPSRGSGPINPNWPQGFAFIPLPWRGGVVAFGFGFWVWQPRHQPPRLALPSPLIRQRGIKANTAVIALFCAFRLG